MPTAKTTRATVVNGKPYVYREDGTLVPAISKTNWAAVDAMTDEQITAAAEVDPDARPMTDNEWARAIAAKPAKVQVGMRLDSDVLNWFKQRGTGYQTRINTVLRRYIEAQKKAG